MNIYIDIETIPDQHNPPEEVNEFEVIQGIKCPKTIKKQETREKWMNESYPFLCQEAIDKARIEAFEKWKDTALMSLHGQICCIGWCIDDNEVQTICAENESHVIHQFFEQTEGLSQERNIVWCGHYIAGFDLPFIHNRSKILGIESPYPLPDVSRPWAPHLFDTSIKMPFTGKDSKKLINICAAFGIPVKTQGHGSEVWQMYKDGRFETIAEYCKEDVVATRQLIRRVA